MNSLHLIDVKDLSVEDLKNTVGRCPSLETLVLEDCSLALANPGQTLAKEAKLQAEHLQLVGLQHQATSRDEFQAFLSLFRSIKHLDIDICPLDAQGIRALLHTFSPDLKTLRCPLWTNITQSQLKSLVVGKQRGDCQVAELQTTKQAVSFSDELILSERRRTKTAQLLSDYVGISPILPYHGWT